jgi:hypothetical protein
MARSSVIRTEEEEASLASENKEERGRAPLSAIFFSPFPFFFPFTCKVGKTGITQVLPRDARRCCQERQAPPRCGAVRCVVEGEEGSSRPDAAACGGRTYMHTNTTRKEQARRGYGHTDVEYLSLPSSSCRLCRPCPCHGRPWGPLAGWLASASSARSTSDGLGASSRV